VNELVVALVVVVVVGCTVEGTDETELSEQTIRIISSKHANATSMLRAKRTRKLLLLDFLAFGTSLCRANFFLPPKDFEY